MSNGILNSPVLMASLKQRFTPSSPPKPTSHFSPTDSLSPDDGEGGALAAETNTVAAVGSVTSPALGLSSPSISNSPGLAALQLRFGKNRGKSTSIAPTAQEALQGSPGLAALKMRFGTQTPERSASQTESVAFRGSQSEIAPGRLAVLQQRFQTPSSRPKFNTLASAGKLDRFRSAVIAVSKAEDETSIGACSGVGASAGIIQPVAVASSTSAAGLDPLATQQCLHAQYTQLERKDSRLHAHNKTQAQLAVINRLLGRWRMREYFARWISSTSMSTAAAAVSTTDRVLQAEAQAQIVGEDASAVIRAAHEAVLRFTGKHVPEANRLREELRAATAAVTELRRENTALCSERAKLQANVDELKRLRSTQADLARSHELRAEKITAQLKVAQAAATKSAAVAADLENGRSAYKKLSERNTVLEAQVTELRANFFQHKAVSVVLRPPIAYADHALHHLFRMQTSASRGCSLGSRRQRLMQTKHVDVLNLRETRPLPKPRLSTTL